MGKTLLGSFWLYPKSERRVLIDNYLFGTIYGLPCSRTLRCPDYKLGYPCEHLRDGEEIAKICFYYNRCDHGRIRPDLVALALAIWIVMALN